jgi:hypothetical protein
MSAATAAIENTLQLRLKALHLSSILAQWRYRLKILVL